MLLNLSATKNPWYRLKLGKRPRNVDVSTLDNTVAVDLAINENEKIANLSINLRNVVLHEGMTQETFLKKVENFVNAVGPTVKIMGEETKVEVT